MAIELPALPFPMDALEPFISKRTLEFHYGKHHQAYVTNVNKLMAGTEFSSASLEDMIRKASGGIFNNAAQVWNHTFYWNGFKAGGNAGEPTGAIAEAINKSFGSFAQFKEKFTAASTTLFGSGWSWLVKKADGTWILFRKAMQEILSVLVILLFLLVMFGNMRITSIFRIAAQIMSTLSGTILIGTL